MDHRGTMTLDEWHALSDSDHAERLAKEYAPVPTRHDPHGCAHNVGYCPPLDTRPDE